MWHAINDHLHSGSALVLIAWKLKMWPYTRRGKADKKLATVKYCNVCNMSCACATQAIRSGTKAFVRDVSDVEVLLMSDRAKKKKTTGDSHRHQKNGTANKNDNIVNRNECAKHNGSVEYINIYLHIYVPALVCFKCSKWNLVPISNDRHWLARMKKKT